MQDRFLQDAAVLVKLRRANMAGATGFGGFRLGHDLEGATDHGAQREPARVLRLGQDQRIHRLDPPQGRIVPRQPRQFGSNVGGETVQPRHGAQYLPLGLVEPRKHFLVQEVAINPRISLDQRVQRQPLRPALTLHDRQPDQRRPAVQGGDDPLYLFGCHPVTQQPPRLAWREGQMAGVELGQQSPDTQARQMQVRQRPPGNDQPQLVGRVLDQPGKKVGVTGTVSIVQEHLDRSVSLMQGADMAGRIGLVQVQGIRDHPAEICRLHSRRERDPQRVDTAARRAPIETCHRLGLAIPGRRFDQHDLTRDARNQALLQLGPVQQGHGISGRAEYGTVHDLRRSGVLPSNGNGPSLSSAPRKVNPPTRPARLRGTRRTASRQCAGEPLAGRNILSGAARAMSRPERPATINRPLHQVDARPTFWRHLAEHEAERPLKHGTWNAGTPCSRHPFRRPASRGVERVDHADQRTRGSRKVAQRS